MKFLKYFLLVLPIFYLLFCQIKVDHLSLGDKYLKEGRISFAREEYKKAHTLNGVADNIIKDRLEKLEFMNHEDKIHYNAALEYDKLGKFDEAINEYEKALKINPRSIKALEGLMIDLFKAGENEKGLQVINKLSGLSFENESTIYHRALYDYSKGYYERCITRIDQIPSINKKGTAPGELRARAASRLAELKEKKDIYARELFIKGVRYIKVRDYKMASLAFQDSISNKMPEDTGKIPDDIIYKKIPVIEIYSKIGIYFNLAAAFELSGKFEEAIAALEKINDIKDNIDIIYYKIAECYSRIGNENEAYKSYLTVMRINGSFPDIYNKLAFCAKKKGDYEKSISYFKYAIEYDPKNPIHLYNLAIMYKKTEKKLEALDTFQKAFSLLSKADNSFKYLITEQINQINSKIDGIKAQK